MRYAELTTADIAALRVLAALEQTYPEAGNQASRTLEGYRKWRLKTWRKAAPKDRDHG